METRGKRKNSGRKANREKHCLKEEKRLVGDTLGAEAVLDVGKADIRRERHRKLAVVGLENG